MPQGFKKHPFIFPKYSIITLERPGSLRNLFLYNMMTSYNLQMETLENWFPPFADSITVQGLHVSKNKLDFIRSSALFRPWHHRKWSLFLLIYRKLFGPCPHPKDKVKDFSLIGYNSHWIPNFSKLAAHLYVLIRTEISEFLPWTEYLQIAFCKFKGLP